MWWVGVEVKIIVVVLVIVIAGGESGNMALAPDAAPQPP
jgi:hypothetical protein